MKEYNQKVKREHGTRIPKVEEHPQTDEDIYKDWMDNHESPQHFQHLQQHVQRQQQEHQ
jgi:hypothetical protein